MYCRILTRSANDKLSLLTRTLALVPSTINHDERAVEEVVAATETPVEIYDWDHGYVPEVLLMSGCKLPQSRQIPLLNSHSRYGVEDVLGSAQQLRVEDDTLVCRAAFSSTPLAMETFVKTEEGHLTDYSVGYRVLKSVWVPKGENRTVGGKTFIGPVLIRTSWRPVELSITPIGADPNAKGRNENIENTGGPQMPEWLRSKLEKLGLRADASEDEAWEYARGLDIQGSGSPEDDRGEQGRAAGDNVVTLESVRQAAADGARSESVRQQDISTMCSRFLGDDDTFSRKLIADGLSVDQARAAIMDEMSRRSGERGPGVAPGTFEVGTEAADKFRQAAEGSLVLRCGGSLQDNDTGAESLRGYNMVELSRECLRNNNQSHMGNARDVVGRALTTSDLPAILSNVAHRFLLMGFDEAEETFDIWTSTIPASDFKEILLPGLSAASDLDKVSESGEYKYGNLTDKAERVQLATYGKIYNISRQALVNDDLSVLSTLPQRMGQAARRKEGDVVYAVLTNNDVMREDGRPLFHTEHKNIGTAKTFGIGPVEDFIRRMRRQRDVGGKTPLNLRMKYILAPVSLEGGVEKFFSSEYIGTQAEPTARNRFFGGQIERVFDARLDDHSETGYYGAAAQGKTVVRSHLDGNQQPYLETRDGWTTDGLETKVRYDVAAGAVDYRGLVRNAGK